MARIKVESWPTLSELESFVRCYFQEFQKWDKKKIQRQFVGYFPQYKGRCAELISESISTLILECVGMSRDDKLLAAIADVHCFSKSVLYISFYLDGRTYLSIYSTDLHKIPRFLWCCERVGIKRYESPRWVLKNYNFVINHFLSWLRMKPKSATEARLSYNYIRVYYLMKRLGYETIPWDYVRCYDFRVLAAYCVLWDRYCTRDIHSKAKLLADSLKDVPLRTYIEVIRLSSPLLK